MFDISKRELRQKNKINNIKCVRSRRIQNDDYTNRKTIIIQPRKNKKKSLALQKKFYVSPREPYTHTQTRMYRYFFSALQPKPDPEMIIKPNFLFFSSFKVFLLSLSFPKIAPESFAFF